MSSASMRATVQDCEGRSKILVGATSTRGATLQHDCQQSQQSCMIRRCFRWLQTTAWFSHSEALVLREGARIDSSVSQQCNTFCKTAASCALAAPYTGPDYRHSRLLIGSLVVACDSSLSSCTCGFAAGYWRSSAIPTTAWFRTTACAARQRPVRQQDHGLRPTLRSGDGERGHGCCSPWRYIASSKHAAPCVMPDCSSSLTSAHVSHKHYIQRASPGCCDA